MKGLKRILIWSLIPITFEILGLLFVDKFYFNDETKFNIKTVDVSSKRGPNKISTKIPEGVKNAKISHKGNYISYYDGEEIKIIDTSNNKTKSIKAEGDAKISSYAWCLDIDRILIAEKINEGNSSYLKFASYNAKRDEKYPLKNEEKNKELKILLPDSKYEVQDISFAGATNVTYVKAGREGARSRIYRINVMNDMELVNYSNGKLGNIAAFSKEDKLVYEDRTNNRIRVAGMRDPIATGENATHYLLGTDKEDDIYIGNGEDNKVKKIFVANLKKNRNNWKIYTLPDYVSKNNIHIAREGKIYVDNPSKNSVLEVSSGKEIKYDGEFKEIYDYGLISKKGSKIIGTVFEK